MPRSLNVEGGEGELLNISRNSLGVSFPRAKIMSGLKSPLNGAPLGISHFSTISQHSKEEKESIRSGVMMEWENYLMMGLSIMPSYLIAKPTQSRELIAAKPFCCRSIKARFNLPVVSRVIES